MILAMPTNCVDVGIELIYGCERVSMWSYPCNYFGIRVVNWSRIQDKCLIYICTLCEHVIVSVTGILVFSLFDLVIFGLTIRYFVQSVTLKELKKMSQLKFPTATMVITFSNFENPPPAWKHSRYACRHML